MERIQLSDSLTLSRIIHGHWRMSDWALSDMEVLNLSHRLIDQGLTSFDTADIYGNYSCEKLFGNALKLDPSVRHKMEIITKCGVSLKSDKYPERSIKTYDYRFDYIIQAVENSLQQLGTDRIDLLLLHRPSPLMNPAEIARAFDQLESSGKVLNFGVSNFNPAQFNMLQSLISQKLVTNQVEISAMHLEHFDNGNIDFFLQHDMAPMSWSPLAHGRAFNPQNDQDRHTSWVIHQIALETGSAADKVMIAWLLHHPVKIMPILGSGKADRLLSMLDAGSIRLTDEQWFRIFIAAKGSDLP